MRFASFLIACVVAVFASEKAKANAVDVVNWMQLAEACHTAILRGEPLKADGLQSVFGQHEDNDWPQTDFLFRGNVGVLQEERPTGATAPIRICTVPTQQGFSAEGTELVTVNFLGWIEKLVASGAYVKANVAQKPKQGIHVIWDSASANARGCDTRLEFSSLTPPNSRTFATLVVKERPGAECGKPQDEGSSK